MSDSTPPADETTPRAAKQAAGPDAQPPAEQTILLPTPPSGVKPAPVPDTPTRPVRYWRWRARIGLGLTLFGLVIFLIGTRPGLFGIDRSPVVGFVQIAVFLTGLAIICIGGYISLTSLWREQPTSIAADIGLRMVATGFVIAVFAGMADIFGLGSQPLPRVPFFGPWQARGVEIGQAFIAIGFLLLLPYKQVEKRKLGRRK